MEEIRPDQYFRTIDGKVIRTLREMPSIISQMSPAAFSHHVNEEKNDFVNWVKFVFHNKKLAKKLEKVRTNREAIAVIEDHFDVRNKKESYFSKILKDKNFPKDIIAGLRKHWHG